MCVKSFRVVKILEQKTRVQIVGLISSISRSIARYNNENKKRICIKNTKKNSYCDCCCTKWFGGKGFSAAICFSQDICVSSDWREEV
jgi:hypothetical protein